MHPLVKFKYCPSCGTDNFKENDNKSKVCLSCGFKYYLNASAAVAAFILDEKHRLLLCKRAQDPAKGTLDLPGGFVDMDESAEEAIIREIWEELNIKTSEIQYLFSIPNEYCYSDFNVRTLDMFYLLKVEDWSMLLPKDDVTDIHFMPLNKIDISMIGLKSIKIAIEKFRKQQLSKR